MNTPRAIDRRRGVLRRQHKALFTGRPRASVGWAQVKNRLTQGGQSAARRPIASPGVDRCEVGNRRPASPRYGAAKWRRRDFSSGRGLGATPAIVQPHKAHPEAAPHAIDQPDPQPHRYPRPRIVVHEPHPWIFPPITESGNAKWNGEWRDKKDLGKENAQRGMEHIVAVEPGAKAKPPHRGIEPGNIPRDKLMPQSPNLPQVNHIYF